jgi:gliding motility-associated-like protein
MCFALFIKLTVNARLLSGALVVWLTVVALVVAALPMYGQACAGASGEVIISETFGSGIVRPSLTGRTTYAISTNPCPTDGQYTIANSVPDTCFSRLWHALPDDHTPGDVAGNFLVVNASEQSGEFYSQAVAGLCSGTQYEFSVWGLNLLKPGICSRPLVPDVAIRIETTAGTLVQLVAIGQIMESATSDWQRYATLFTVPANTDGVVVKLINRQGEGGCGNDLALDDIQLVRCGACTPPPVFLPDVFTPNNDGLNDTMPVFLRNVQSFSLAVYDRWGSIVFATTDLAEAWDGAFAGKPCPTGSYSWVLSYQVPGANNTIDTITHTSHVLLLR